MVETVDQIILEDKYILLNSTELEAIIGVGRTTLYRAIKEDGFPKPIRIGRRFSRWRKSEVLEWIDSRPQGLEYEF